LADWYSYTGDQLSPPHSHTGGPRDTAKSTEVTLDETVAGNIQ